MDSKHNPYQALGITPEASQKDITKAYRKKALEYHPDKLKNFTNKYAQEKQAKMFMLVKHAYDTLMDDEKRAGVDAELKAKLQRAQKVDRMTLERQKMKLDLEKNELAAKKEAEDRRNSRFKKYDSFSTNSRDKASANRSDQNVDKDAMLFKQQAEREDARRTRNLQKEILKSQQLNEQEFMDIDSNAAKELEELNSTIKLRWSDEDFFASESNSQIGSQYINHSAHNTSSDKYPLKIDEAYLKKISSAFGPVDHIVMHIPKSSSKHHLKKKTALVVFSNIISAYSFMDAQVNDHPQLRNFERSWLNPKQKPLDEIANLELSRESAAVNEPSAKQTKTAQEYNVRDKTDTLKRDTDYSLGKNWIKLENVNNLFSKVDPKSMAGSNLAFKDFETIVLSRMRTFGSK
ncbi:Pre-mRNA-splicing factor cwf23 [Smittium culicis]|uniref:Pre-mRNA-splicing factor cwf23 n=1 Tax=Smittium culicis TaxID=133412 RepID=A0A1R1XAG4_9FUNG|nr:Pre-mRNA-splicing factor cwf23 [Smittium culicis]